MRYGKRVLCIIGGIFVLIGAFMSGHYAGAASKTPGGTEDPLITLSYLESRLSGQTDGARVLQLSSGKTLLGTCGTQIIVLRGSVTAVNGDLADLTEGSLTKDDTSLFLYHNYIVTEEKVGCKALSSSTILVIGECTIK
ncbi:MAG: hypothetical protein PUC30_01360 [Lachnospiraceae bacterium]|nr:hypothetical protein [Lachnospiraceae bacterium]